MAWGTYSTATTLASTTLNGIVNAASVLSSAHDNSTTKDELAVFELYLAAFSPVADGYVEVIIIDRVDSTNFGEYGSSGDEMTGLRRSWQEVEAGTSVTRRIVFPPMLIIPDQFKVVVVNNTGATWASSGNTLKVRTFSRA